MENQDKKATKNIKVYKRRWIILILFMGYALGNAFQWVEYTIVMPQVTKYYNVSTVAVDWTTICFLVVYPIIMIPGCYLIERQNVRTTALFGCLGTTLGAIVKLFSVRPDGFWIVLLGQIIGSAAQLCIMSQPPKLAAVWFSPSELSLVNSLGMFGSQFGVGLGFFLATRLITNTEDINIIGADLQRMCWLHGIFMIAVSIACLIYFPNQPPLPPSIVQAEIRNLKKMNVKEFSKMFIGVVQLPGFLLCLTAYSIIIGVTACFTTFLGQFVREYFKDSEKDAGLMGILAILAGTVGVILGGFYLDKSHKYKSFNLFLCYMSALSIVSFLLGLQFKNISVTYIASIAIGFFLNTYMATGIELGVELTFPAEESISSGLLVGTSQGIGVIIIWIVEYINQRTKGIWSLVFLTLIVLVGTVLTHLVPNINRRQLALKQAQHIEVLSVLKT